jgi:hypothetical protein
MNVLRQPVPWNYHDLVVRYLRPDDSVIDIGTESLLFWLRGLDGVHADLDGSAALSSATALNRVLAGNVDERGFVTKEHRYFAVATRSTQGNRSNRLVRSASVRHNP